MSMQGKHSPLSVNVLCALLQNSGLTINANATALMGSSTSTSNYSAGTLVLDTILSDITSSIKLAYDLLTATSITQTTYDNLISIGSSSIPILGNSKPSSYTDAYTGELTSYGFLRLLALQAYTEFNYGTGTYPEFINSFSLCETFKQQQNATIASLINSKDYLKGIYSNMNDLTTSDITGVNLATVYWGQDLIASGKVIDLKNIDKFGSPYILLKTLQSYNAVTKAIGIALLASDLTTTEINDLLSNSTATLGQEKKLYNAFTLIKGTDLTDVLVILNVQTKNLDSLADVLNPQKLFPNSYKSLTVPSYNTNPNIANSKIYYLIYQNDGIDSHIVSDYKDYLGGILPTDIGIACGAFSMAMQQIKNISNMNIEKFAQVVTNLEVTVGLTVNGTSSPNNNDVLDTMIAQLALGSGVNGTYTMCDFFGAMSGVPYNLSKIKGLIDQLTTASLQVIYSNIKTLLSGAGPYTTLQSLIDQANTEIATIQTNFLSISQELNTLYNNLGKQLLIEKNARTLALTSTIDSTSLDVYNFVNNVERYAEDTNPYQSAQVLERICDLSTIGGQSIVALMREVRNAKRLGFAGGILDNNIPNEIPVESTNGLGFEKITGEAQTPGSFAGSPETNLIPQNLDIFHISSTLLPAVVTPDQAIDDVVKCNCDCWDIL